ncbi:hypothetical protein DRF62_02125 [Chryseobacterium piscium]|uniref:Uncharacterized protein n=1 Tax=Chryseobacterium piscium TaxID=333702 RepID=A0A3D9BTZ7_9FLAO|nr:hypothetical protein [Chryseobacterium piscium]REC56977.1 hypothetical protein DRF62_02125 [Chryseobacterium piscium]
MKTVKVKMTRKVTYEAVLKVSDEDFELIKDIDNEDVEMYDRSTIKDVGNGIKTISTNKVYEILDDLDDPTFEIDKEETMFDVFVTPA